ncbi:MAG: 50S ribosomal protein L13 [Candidatus Andersenbacteria bacterium]
MTHLRTRQVIPAEQLTRTWHLVDAKGQVLGRVAVQVAELLQGRRKTNWSHMQDVGDHVVVLNAAQVRVTGRKAENKTYFHHTTYPGHLKATSFKDLLAKRPTEVLRHAVVGMLPDNRLKKSMLRRLHLFAAETHPFAKQFSK